MVKRIKLWITLIEIQYSSCDCIGFVCTLRMCISIRIGLDLIYKVCSSTTNTIIRIINNNNNMYFHEFKIRILSKILLLLFKFVSALYCVTCIDRCLYAMNCWRRPLIDVYQFALHFLLVFDVVFEIRKRWVIRLLSSFYYFLELYATPSIPKWQFQYLPSACECVLYAKGNIV